MNMPSSINDYREWKTKTRIFGGWQLFMRYNFVASYQRKGMKQKGRILNDSEISSLGNEVNVFIDKDKEIQLPKSH